MTYTMRPLSAALWRMLPIRFQRSPLSGEGARLYGGRWNPRGVPALYLATDHATAVAEFYQGMPKPGTLVPYSINASLIADLTDGHAAPCDMSVERALNASWKDFSGKGPQPPSWQLAATLIAAGAEGALVPSVQNRGGCSLVLWRWHDAMAADGEGAALTLMDPERALN